MFLRTIPANYLHTTFENTLKNLWNDSPLSTFTQFQTGIRFEEKDEKIVVSFDVPGVIRDSIEVNYDEDTINVTGKRDKDTKYEYSFYLGNKADRIDLSKAELNLENGVLTISYDAPKAEKVKKGKLKLS